MNLQEDIYEITFAGGVNNSYVFATNRKVVYEVKFKPSSYIFDEFDPFAETEFAFEFVIEIITNPTGENPAFDKLIAPTITAIFEDFFKQKEKIIVYVCDDADGKAKVRNRKFDTWFRSFNVHYVFMKFDFMFGSKEEEYYTSVVMRFDNPNLAKILNDFQKMMEKFQKQNS